MRLSSKFSIRSLILSGISICGISLLVVACERPQDKEPASGTPKTFYGQTVHSTKKLSNTFDEKADELREQADELGQDE